MLTLLRALLGISGTSKDVELQFYLDKAKEVISQYLGVILYDVGDLDEDDSQREVLYINQRVELAIYYYKNKDYLGITQMSQGSRSQSMSQTIPQSLMDSLPRPFIKVVG